MMTIPEMPFLQESYERQRIKHPTLFFSLERLLLISWTVLVARQRGNVNYILHIE